MVEGEQADRDLRDLMRRAQCGDRDAYTALLTTIAPRIRRMIRSRRPFLDPQAVDDLVQDVLLSVHSVRATYDPGRPFLPWLAAITSHRLTDAARRYARRDAREVSFDEASVTFLESAANTSDEGPGDTEALAHAIETLPAGQRQAIDLLKLQGLSLKEASAATGQSVGALKLATHRAMRSLRRMLRGPDQHEH